MVRGKVADTGSDVRINCPDGARPVREVNDSWRSPVPWHSCTCEPSTMPHAIPIGETRVFQILE